MAPRIEASDWKLASKILANSSFQFFNRQWFVLEIEPRKVYVVLDRQLNKSLFRGAESDEDLVAKLRFELHSRKTNSFQALKQFISP